MIFRWFKRLRKPKYFDKLTFQFKDTIGYRYYAYKDQYDIPMERFSFLQKTSLELSRQLSETELTAFLDSMESNIEKTVAGTQKVETSLGRITALITEIRSRNEGIIHTELMFDIAAALYIREDEDSAEVDEEIHKQKVAQFRKDSKGKLYDFFYNAGLKAYLPFLPLLKDDLEQLLEFSDKKREAIAKAVKQLG